MPSLGNAYVTIRGDLRELKSDLNKALDAIKNLETKADASSKEFAKSFNSALDKAERDVKRFISVATPAFNRLQADIFGVKAAFTGMGATIGAAQKAFSSFTGTVALLAGGYGIQAVGRSFLETAVFIDRTEKALQGLTGTNKAAAQSMSFIRSESERLGLAFRDQLEGFMQLTAAANGTKLQGETIKYVWSGLSTAVTALQLDSERAGNSIYALVQMISKGVITSEELKRQLGDNIPGATTIAARAMNVTTEELNKMLKAGTLLADEFLPKLALEFYRTYGEAAVVSSKSAQAAINRLKNAYVDLVQAISHSGVLEAFASALGDVTQGVHDWVEANDKLLQQDMKGYIADAKEFLSNVVEIGSSVKAAWDAIPSEVKEIGLVGLVLYGISMHPILASLGAVMAAVGAVVQAGETPSIADAQGQIGRYEDKILRLQTELAAVWQSMDSIPPADSGRLAVYAKQAEELTQGISDARKEIDLLTPKLEAAKASAQAQAQKALSAPKGLNGQTLAGALSIPDITSIDKWSNSVAIAELKEASWRAEREKGLRLSEEEIAAAKKKEEEIKKYLEGLEQELATIGLDSVAKERLTAQEKGLTGARLEGAYAIIAQTHASKEAWKAAEEANDAIAKNIADGEAMAIKADAERERKREADAKKEEAFLKEARDKRFKEEEHYLERVQDATADTFYDIFKNTEEGWQGLFDRIGDYFLKLLAEMAAQAIAKPIIVPILQSIVGGSGSSASGDTSLLQSAGNTIGNGFFSNTSVGGYISGALNTPLWTASGESTVMGLSGPTGVSNYGQFTLGNAVSAYGMGSLGYSTVGNWVGLPQGGASSYGAGLGAAGGQMAGSALASGALAGSAYGSWAPGIGTAIGAIVGGILGSLVNFNGDGNRHLTVQTSPTLSYGGTMDFGAPYEGFRDRAIQDSSHNPYYGNAFGAIEDATNAAAQSIFTAVDEMLAKMPEDIASSIREDLAGATFEFNKSKSWTLASDSFEAGMTNILTQFGTDLYGQITPYIEKGLARYAQKMMTTGTQAELFGRLSENNIMRTSLTESGLFNADFSKKDGVSFEDYMTGVDEWLTTMGKIESVFTAVDTTVERILNPLSAFESGLVSIDDQFNTLRTTLYQVGASTAELDSLEAKRIQARENYTNKQSTSIDDQLTDRINKRTLSDEDYQLWKLDEDFKGVLESIGELGEGHQDLLVKAIRLHNIEKEAIVNKTESTEEMIAREKELRAIERERAASQRSFEAIKMGVGGVSAADIRLNQMSEKYGWESAGYSAGGVMNWPKLIDWVKNDLPNSTLQNFQDVAERLNLPLEEVLSDVQFLGETITGAFVSAAEDSKTIANAWSKIAENIKSMILDLKFTSSNPASIDTRLKLINQEIIRVTDLFNIGTTPQGKRQEYAEQLIELYKQRTDMAQEAYQRPSQEYATVYDNTLTRLNQIQYMIEGYATEYDIQASQLTQLQYIAANTSAMAMALEGLSSYDSGTAYVPSDRIAKIHKGERIIPAAENGAWGSSGATINLTINAPGGDGKAIAREIQKVLPGIIRNNGAIRSELRSVH